MGQIWDFFKRSISVHFAHLFKINWKRNLKSSRFFWHSRPTLRPIMTTLATVYITNECVFYVDIGLLPVVEQDMTMYEMKALHDHVPLFSFIFSHSLIVFIHSYRLLCHSIIDIARSQCQGHNTNLRHNTLLPMPFRCVTCSEQFLPQAALLCSSRSTMLPYLFTMLPRLNLWLKQLINFN